MLLDHFKIKAKSGKSASFIQTSLYVFILLTLILITGQAQAQQHFGVNYHPRESVEDLHDDLSVLSGMGVERVMIEADFPEDQLSILAEYNFQITIRSSSQFPTRHRLLYMPDDLDEAVDNIRDRFIEEVAFDQVVLFRHGAMEDRQFRNNVEPYIHELSNADGQQLTFIAAYPPPDDMLQIIPEFILEVSSSGMLGKLDNPTQKQGFSGIYYRPDNEKFDLRDFQNIMDEMEDARLTPVFFDWEWFVLNVTDDPFIAEVIEAYATDPDAAFPNPGEETEPLAANTLILILLILWGSVIVHYVFVPPYQKSLIRFFTTHSFFVGDIIYRRIRIGFPNLIVLLQQGLLAGIYVNGLLFHYLSDLGRDAITHNLLFLSELPSPFLTFVISFIAVILLNGLFICWIYLPHRHLQSLNQIAVILMWPQHLNLIVVSVLMALLAAGISGFIITVLAISYLIILFGSFILAAFDASRYIYIRFYYYPLTIGLYLASLVFLYFFVLSGNGYVNAWELAVSLS